MGPNRNDTGVLRAVVAASMLLVAARDGVAQDEKDKEVIEAIKKHFKSVTPEFWRYKYLTVYGDTISGTAITKQQLERERALLEAAASAGLLKTLPPEVMNLGHNLIVHDPTAAVEYLKALHESAHLTMPEAGPAVYAATLAAGELGEQMAVAELASDNKDRRLYWARYLQQYVLYLSSAEPIHKQLAKESDAAVKMSLIRALAMIGSPASVAVVKDVIERSTDDEVQAVAIVAFAMLVGFDGIGYVEKIVPLGEKSDTNRRHLVEWLKEETRPGAKYGRKLANDTEFVSRFGDLRGAPIIRWLDKEHLLDKSVLKENPKLTPEQKNELLDLLVDSKGFGLEAVQGSLFRSLSKGDEPILLKIRSVGFYCLLDMSVMRSRTIGIMIRQLRLGP